MLTPRRPTRRISPIIAEPKMRFAAGWRLIPEIVEGLRHRPGPSRIAPDISVDVVRSEDMVVFTVEGYGIELVQGQKPRLLPKPGRSSRLLVRFSFQHLAERAIYEGLAPVPQENPPTGPKSPPTTDSAQPDGESARPNPPVAARPAKASRLVFDVPDGEVIPFTVEGILDAMARLPMAVHPLAKPRVGRIVIPTEATLLHIGGGLVARPGPNGVVISSATNRMTPPNAGTATGLSTLSRNTRHIRRILAGSAGTTVRGAGGVAAEETPETVRIGGRTVPVRRVVGTGALARPDRPIRAIPRPTLSRPTRQLETSIEAPFRLIISPSNRGGWAHASSPVRAEEAEHRVELWHTRLGVRHDGNEGVSVDERASFQRIVRALWARDREAFANWQSLKVAPHVDSPFRSSLDGADRHMLVRQSSESWLDKNSKPISPGPVAADALWLSSLGAWLDLHGGWTTLPYSEAAMASILLWDHVAPMGRDQYVRVVYPGYLYPFGHRCTLVKLTERKMKDASPSVAGLYQRKFLVVGEPVKQYSKRNMPLTEVRIAPLVTPTLSPDPGNAQNSFFFPMVDNKRFNFILHCLDKEGRPVKLVTPLMWVAEHFQGFSTVETTYRNDAASTVPAQGQEIAFADVARGGDTMVPAVHVRFDGDAKVGSSVPKLRDAKVEIPAAQNLSPVGPVTIEYGSAYLAKGFGGTDNAGEVWAELVGTLPKLAFGGSTSAGSDKAGGFMQPDMPIAGLSRIKGTVGDVVNSAKGDFDPASFLAGALPKLFGIVSLVDLLDAAGVDLNDAPNVVSEALDRIEGFLSDLERAKTAAEDAVADAQRLVQRAQGKAAEIQQKANQALQTAQQLEATVSAAVNQVIAQFAALQSATQQAVTAALQAPLQALRTAADLMDQAAPHLPPLVKQQLVTIAKTLRTAVDTVDLIEDIFRFLNGLASSGKQANFRFEWKPKLQSWPSPTTPFLGITDPILEVKQDSLVLAVDGRANGKGETGVEVLAELQDFILNLLPGETLVRFKFDHLSFKAGSSGKAEVDVILQDIEFVGMLSFIEVLKDLIPFDGFSDPPYLDVTAEGLTAGFTLGLPNVAVGVFNLSNMSLGADVQVPFLGKAVTVGFNFCTRERPFALAVSFIGGGGWFLIRLSPDGLDVLELGLEAGAMLSVDFGVASGSISAMLGIYMRLEGDAGSLTGYFRLRGEVDVLGLISASIELYLELLYQFDTGKMVGRAKLTIKVEVFIFSGSVTIEAERRFAGSNGDPNFADVMLLPDGSSPAWSEYCLAFAA